MSFPSRVPGCRLDWDRRAPAPDHASQVELFRARNSVRWSVMNFMAAMERSWIGSTFLKGTITLLKERRTIPSDCFETRTPHAKRLGEYFQKSSLRRETLCAPNI